MAAPSGVAAVAENLHRSFISDSCNVRDAVREGVRARLGAVCVVALDHMAHAPPRFCLLDVTFLCVDLSHDCRRAGAVAHTLRAAQQHKWTAVLEYCNGMSSVWRGAGWVWCGGRCAR
ncbi:MAG: hypothetical protein EOO65_04660 [Methanosarcinales archaeon]|nr:MAG: hypothetical protein EOO65_04660 [Methanosarcinales archaeon]